MTDEAPAARPAPPRRMQQATFLWSGGIMTPVPRYARLCAQQFVEGEEYILEVPERRSTASHRHFFAALNEHWHSLPDPVAKKFPSAEHLRKWAMIHCHYCHEDDVIWDTNKDAVRAAAWMRRADAYCILKVSDNVCKRFTAMSITTMDKDTFQKMKTEVLDLTGSMIGVTRKETDRAARQGANR